jgi:hypothetical protein
MPLGPPPRRYTVQILLPRAVRLDANELLHQLRVWRDGVELLPGAYPTAFAIPTEDLPLLVALFDAAPDAYAAPLCDALTWTPEWHESWDEMTRHYKASLVIAMTAQRPINYASALLAFLAVLDTVLFALPERDRAAAALHWMPAQLLLTFDRYRTLRTELGPSGPAVNIRVLNATGRPGELLADTIGLAELGLPDLQIVFSDRDPVAIARHLRQLVRGMFVGDRLDCAWIEEASLVPPARDALTLQLD